MDHDRWVDNTYPIAQLLWHRAFRNPILPPVLPVAPVIPILPAFAPPVRIPDVPHDFQGTFDEWFALQFPLAQVHLELLRGFERLGNDRHFQQQRLEEERVRLERLDLDDGDLHEDDLIDERELVSIEVDPAEENWDDDEAIEVDPEVEENWDDDEPMSIPHEEFRRGEAARALLSLAYGPRPVFPPPSR